MKKRVGLGVLAVVLLLAAIVVIRARGETFEPASMSPKLVAVDVDRASAALSDYIELDTSAPEVLGEDGKNHVSSLVTLNPDENVTREELKAHCGEYLSKFKVPAKIRVLKEDRPVS